MKQRVLLRSPSVSCLPKACLLRQLLGLGTQEASQGRSSVLLTTLRITARVWSTKLGRLAPSQASAFRPGGLTLGLTQKRGALATAKSVFTIIFCLIYYGKNTLVTSAERPLKRFIPCWKAYASRLSREPLICMMFSVACFTCLKAAASGGCCRVSTPSGERCIPILQSGVSLIQTVVAFWSEL